VMGLERGPLSLVSTTAELLERKSRGFGLEIRKYGRRDLSRWPRGTLYSKRVGTNFVDKRRSLGRYSLLANSDHTVLYIDLCIYWLNKWWIRHWAREAMKEIRNIQRINGEKIAKKIKFCKQNIGL
jgi:hypothetical protein